MVTGSGRSGASGAGARDGFARFRGRVNFDWSTSCPSPKPCSEARTFPALRRSSISTSARTRRAERTRTSKCSPTSTPRRMLPCSGQSLSSAAESSGDDDDHRGPRPQHSRSSQSNPQRRAAREASKYRPTSRPPIFDWRELQRWGIPESRLPPGSVVRYRAPSLWS